MALFNTGNTALDLYLRFTSALTRRTGFRTAIGSFFTTLLQHTSPPQETAGQHFSATIAGPYYADDAAFVALRPEIRSYGTEAEMTAWAAPNGSIVLLLTATNIDRALWMRVQGAWRRADLT